jgi:hypothetical protein
LAGGTKLSDEFDWSIVSVKDPLSTASDVDPAAPFGHLVLHMNRELIHHGSEILVLQDLHAAMTDGAQPDADPRASEPTD